MVRLGGVEQQQGMSSRCGVDHDEAVLALVHDPRKGSKHSDLLGARAPQILLEQRAAGSVQVRSRCPQHFGCVSSRLEGGIDPAHSNAVDRVTEGFSDVSFRIVVAVDFVSTPRKFDSDVHGARGLATPPLPSSDHAMTAVSGAQFRDLSRALLIVRDGNGGPPRDPSFTRRVRRAHHSDETEGQERKSGPQPADPTGIGRVPPRLDAPSTAQRSPWHPSRGKRR